MSALRSLLAVFKISVDDKELDNAHKKIHSFGDRLKEAGKALGEALVVREVAEFFKSTIEAGARLADLSNKLGLGAQELQRFQFAAGTAGVESESAAHSLGFLNKAVGEAVTSGGEAAQTFSALHVAVKDAAGGVRPVGDVLFDVADAFKKLNSPQERAAYAMKLFGREGQALVPVLAGGSESLRELYTEFHELGGGMGDDFVKQAKKTDDELLKLRVAMTALKSRVVGAALPSIMRFVDGLKRMAVPLIAFLDKSHSLGQVMTFLGGVAGLKLLGTLYKLGREFGILKPGVMGFVGSLFKLGVPLLLFGALALAVQDFVTAMEGGDSVLGDVLTQMEGVKGKQAFIDSMRASWEDLKSTLTDVAPLAKDIVEGLVKGIPLVIKAFLGAVLIAKAFADSLKAIVDLVVDGLSAIVTGDSVPLNKDMDANGAKILKDWSMFGDLVTGKHADNPAVATVPPPPPDSGPTYPAVPGAVSAPGSLQLPEITIPGTVHRAAQMPAPQVNQKNQINITVPPSDTPKQTGKDIGDALSPELQRQMQNAIYSTSVP